MPSAWQIQPASTSDWQTTTGIANLHLNNNVPKPTPNPKTALVRIRAAALNARDMMVVSHDPRYLKTIPDLTPCADGAGIIGEVGIGSKWSVGDKVMLMAADWIDGPMPTLDSANSLGAGSIHGTLREYAVVRDDLLIRAPSKLTYEQIAALPAAGGTVINALFFGPDRCKKGDTILTLGTGGVSCLAIQIAAAVGATVIVTSSSDSKLAIAKTLGATHLINYSTNPNWDEEVLRITGGKGVDNVIENAGAKTIEQSIQATRQGGLISLIGFLSGSKETDLIFPLIAGGKTLRGVFGVNSKMNEEMMRIVEEYDIKPYIAKVYPWADAKKAFEALVKQSEVGKLVVKVGGE